jgi:outer membrane protein TolC
LLGYYHASSQKHILEERLRNAEELAKMYAKRLQTGDANALETNKINLELLNVRTEASLNETALRNKQQELNTLNGNSGSFRGKPISGYTFPKRLSNMKSEVMATDRTLMALGNESLVARKQIAVNKSQWLPKLELATAGIQKQAYLSTV